MALACWRSLPGCGSAAVQNADLVEWVRENGGSVNGVVVSNLAGRDGGSGWGLKTTEECQEAAKLVDLPQECHITYNASTDSRLLALINQVPDELWGAKLALQLLVERVQGNESRFSAYINYLPQGFPGIPVFFGKDAVDSLQYPPVVEQVKKRGRWLHGFSTGPLKQVTGTPLDPFSGVSVDINALGWAMAAVTSRAFRTKGPEQPAALLPLIDMCNHSFEPNCEIRPTTRGGIGLFAKSKIAAGEPLLISYGPLSNDFLLMDYGFVLPANPNDRVQLRFEIGLLETGLMVATAGSKQPIMSLDITPWKRTLLEQLKLVGAGANKEVLIGGDPPIDPRLLAAVRLVLADDKEELQGRKLQTLGDWMHPMHKQNELLAMRLLTGVCAVALSNFPTTLDADVEMLAGKPPAAAAGAEGDEPPQRLAPDVELAVRFRIERKRQLRDAVMKLAQRMQVVMEDPKVPTWQLETSSGGKTKSAAPKSKGFGGKATK